MKRLLSLLLAGILAAILLGCAHRRTNVSGKISPTSAANGTLENLCDSLGTLEIRLNTPERVILHVFQVTITMQGINEPADGTATVCEPDRTCEGNLKARVQFKDFKRKGAAGSYVIERSDGHKQAGSFNVRRKPLNICE